MLAAGFAGGLLCGSIPCGLLIGRYGYGVDLRAHGSGNIGAANALRTIGKAGAIAVLVLDAAKGAIPVSLALAWASPGSALTVAYAAGAGALIGHCFTPWLRFKGGKGIATSLGILLSLAWPSGLIALATYALVARMTRISAVGSLTGAGVGAIGLAFTRGRAGALYGIASFALLVYTHRSNLARMRNGRELPISPPSPQS